MDRVAQTGVVGRANNVPASLTPASDVATLSLFGYDPLEVYTGRAPLETAAMGIRLGPHDWAIRCNLVTIEDGKMRDFTAGHIGSADGRALVEAVDKALGGPAEVGGLPPGSVTLEFHPGVSYRNILVFRTSAPAPFTAETRSQPPHDIPDRPINGYVPQGPGSYLLRDLMTRSQDVLADHPVNKARVARGERPATQIWLWGQGKAPSLRPFTEVYGKRGAISSGVDLVRGVGALLGWTRIDAPGVTDYLDNDYAAQGRAAIAALQDHDLVCVHVEAPDEASHEGRADAKVQALEAIDRDIVGPLLEALPRFGDWRIFISPDHRTPLRTRAHAHGAVPFALAGTGVAARGQPAYDEAVGAASDFAFDKGHEVMRHLLG
jgi:2,3-bisphosphoglycerate-independent phosphoglycerate mutase